MDFSLSEEQISLQSEIGKALARSAPLSRLRRAAASPQTLDDDVWATLTALGLPGLLVPETFGGLGLGLLDAALAAEVMGRHATPAPFVAPCLIAPLALVLAGSQAQRTERLPSIAAGRMRIAAAVSDATSGARGDAAIRENAGKLSGRIAFTLDVAGSHEILVAAPDGRLWLVARDAPGLEETPLSTTDRTRSASSFVLDGVEAEPLPGSSATVLNRLTDAARLALAADLLGAADAMVERAVAYAKIRQQFGRPIGAFQAVKHLCADMVAELEPLRALVWYAGYAWDEVRPDAHLTCLHAKAQLGEAGRFIARTATELHGGIGITDDLGLHYWFKRIAWSRQVLGSPERLREEAAMATMNTIDDFMETEASP